MRPRPPARATLFGLALIVLGAASASAQPIVTVGVRSLALKDDTDLPVAPRKRKVSLSLRAHESDPVHSIEPPGPGSSGDPTEAGASGGGAVLTFYNSAGSGEKFTILLPASGWRSRGNSTKGARYAYAADSGEAVRNVRVRRRRLVLRGGRSMWSYTLNEASQGRIGVRLTLGTGITWCAEAVAKRAGNPPSAAGHDRADRFIAQPNSSPVQTCPAVPSLANVLVINLDDARLDGLGRCPPCRSV